MHVALPTGHARGIGYMRRTCVWTWFGVSGVVVSSLASSTERGTKADGGSVQGGRLARCATLPVAGSAFFRSKHDPDASICPFVKSSRTACADMMSATRRYLSGIYGH